MAGETGPPRYAVGCALAIPGFFAGGMIGAAIAKLVGAVRGCTPPQGFPACDIWAFVLPCGVIGSVMLATVVMLRLRPGKRDEDPTPRS
jgi:Flp pilus assembly protein protease CpaA